MIGVCICQGQGANIPHLTPVNVAHYAFSDIVSAYPYKYPEFGGIKHRQHVGRDLLPPHNPHHFKIVIAPHIYTPCIYLF